MEPDNSKQYSIYQNKWVFSYKDTNNIKKEMSRISPFPVNLMFTLIGKHENYIFSHRFH